MKVAEGIMRGAAGVDKPILVCFMGKVASKPAIERMKSAGLAVYTFPEEAAHALAALAGTASGWIGRGPRRQFCDVDHARIRHVFEHGARADGRT